jgi:hypothetical protein
MLEGFPPADRIALVRWPLFQRLPLFGYGEGMTVEAIKEEISRLSDEEREQLFNWIAELEEQSWDKEMERDFAPGGRGAGLLAKVEADIAAGKFRPVEEFCAEKKQQRK